jgi:phage/plasmid-associated DNA primase
VLLLGEGRNGKSLLLKMLESLFGKANVSNVTRQNISEQSPVVLDLNGKLLNVVYDGQAVYLKDSGAEKTLIAGEPFGIRRLYESTATLVQTSALFVEGLQKEPKSNDKSSALQKRLVRFMFPNVYALDHKFEKSMLKEESLGAFLSLLIDRYVKEDEVAQRLAPTQKAIELQLEHMYVNSLALQFLKWHEETDALGIQSLLGEEVSHLVKAFQSWRLKENDLGTWAEPDVVALFTPLINTERRSVRVDGKPRKIRVFTSLKDESTAFLNTMKGSDDEAILDALVDD